MQRPNNQNIESGYEQRFSPPRGNFRNPNQRYEGGYQHGRFHNPPVYYPPAGQPPHMPRGGPPHGGGRGHVRHHRWGPPPNSYNYDQTQKYCHQFEQFGVCRSAHFCNDLHRPSMDKNTGSAPPPSKRVICKYYQNCVRGLRCTYIHMVPHAPRNQRQRNYGGQYRPQGNQFENNNNNPYQGQPRNYTFPQNNLTYNNHRRHPCKYFNKTKGCLIPNCNDFHEKIPDDQKRVVLCVGGEGSGRSTLGNVTLWSQDFTEGGRRIRYLDRDFGRGYDENNIVFDSEGIGVSNQDEETTVLRLADILLYTVKHYGGINCFIFASNGQVEPDVNTIQLILNFLGEEKDVRFIFARTHFPEVENYQAENNEKERIVSFFRDRLFFNLPSENILVLDNPPNTNPQQQGGRPGYHEFYQTQPHHQQPQPHRVHWKTARNASRKKILARLSMVPSVRYAPFNVEILKLEMVIRQRKDMEKRVFEVSNVLRGHISPPQPVIDEDESLITPPQQQEQLPPQPQQDLSVVEEGSQPEKTEQPTEQQEQPTTKTPEEEEGDEPSTETPQAQQTPPTTTITTTPQEIEKTKEQIELEVSLANYQEELNMMSNSQYEHLKRKIFYRKEKKKNNNRQ